MELGSDAVATGHKQVQSPPANNLSAVLRNLPYSPKPQGFTPKTKEGAKCLGALTYCRMPPDYVQFSSEACCGIYFPSHNREPTRIMYAAIAALPCEPLFGPRMTDDVKSSLLSAFRQMLKPFVRILLRHDVSYGEFADVVKLVYCDLALKECGIPEKRQTDSRVAIVTGLTRKEVHRLRTGGPDLTKSSNLSRVARVLQGWTQDPDFIGPYGVPLEIPFNAESGVSFAELVRRHSGDMPPRAMLDELLRVKAALETPDGYVRLLNRTYLPSPFDPAGMERLGNVVTYFVDTVDFNLQKKRPGLGRFERYAMTLEGLRPTDYSEFDNFVREQGQEFLEKIDNWLSSHEVKGGHKLPATQALKTGVGVFHFVDYGKDSD